MKPDKITFIEEGRLSDNEMSNCFGGAVCKPKTYTNCSDIGPGSCSDVKGDYLTVVKNCAHNLYTCDSFMRVCSNEDSLAVCRGVPNDAKAVKLPTAQVVMG